MLFDVIIIVYLQKPGKIGSSLFTMTVIRDPWIGAFTQEIFFNYVEYQQQYHDVPGKSF